MSCVKRVSKQLAIISMTDILQQVPGEKGLEGDATLPCFKLLNLEQVGKCNESHRLAW